METSQKLQIQQLIATEKSRLGSYSKVAKKCQVSEATISLIRNTKWDQVTDELFLRVGHKLGYRPESWTVCTETRDYKYISAICENAKKKSMFMILSYEAGSGKTTGLEGFCKTNAEKGAFYLQCREWSSKVLLQKIISMLGVSQPRGYKTADDLLEVVVKALSEHSSVNPILCFDEVDKLKPAALRVFIYLFNELEDKIAVLISGTENLAKELQSGVRYSKKGYDEIESRFGRTYLPMVGANRSDITSICFTNGITDDHIIDTIWQKVGTKRKVIESKEGKQRTELVCSDLRTLKKLIQTAQMKQAA